MASINPAAVEKMSAPGDINDWTQEQGKAVAAKIGLKLTDAHWEVVYFLRNHCKANGSACSARQVSRALNKRFEDQGGKRYLYSLFPGGPVMQACEIGGLPLPANTLDLSFGTAH